MKSDTSALEEVQSKAESSGLHVSPSTTRARWLREPLVHFLLIGAVLFSVSSYMNRGHSSNTSYRIRLTEADLNQLELFYMSQWHRSPTPEEFSRLVEDRVRDEVLYREALGMGLDKDDTIVKRRMAQKMEFLSENVANSHAPSQTELNSWYEKNKQRFAQPGKLTFRHLYFSPDHRGDQTMADAKAALKQLANQPENARVASLFGDRFMLQNKYENSSSDDLAKDFGADFAESVFKLKPGSWQGPLQSGYGLHLVFIESITPGRVPSVDEVAIDVKTAWLAEQRKNEWDKAYQTMRGKYEVELPAKTPMDSKAIAPVAKPVPLPSEGVR